MNENPASGFYAWIHSLRTVRSPQRWLGGVVAGIADRIGLDHTLARALFVVLTLLTAGLTVLAYGLAWMVLPEPDGRIHAREAGQGRWTSGMTGGLVLGILGAVGLFTPPYGPDGGWWDVGGLLGLAVIGLFVWLVASRSGPRALPPGPAGAASGAPSAAVNEPVFLAPSDTGWYASGPRPPSPGPSSPTSSPADRAPEGRDPMTAPSAHYQAPYPPPAPAAPQPATVDRTPPSLSGSTQLLVIGVAVLAGAAVAALKYLGVFTAGWGVIWAASLATALGVMAVGLIVGAILGRGGGGLTVTTALLVIPVLLATGGTFVRGDWDGAWDSTWDGTVRGDSRTGYDLSFGSGLIDLTGEPGSIDPGADPVRLDVSFSEAELIVPHDVDVYLTVDNAFSSVNSEPAVAGDGRVQVVDAPTDRRLEIDADLAFSTLTVRVDDPTTTPTEQE
ncbi:MULTISPECIES: PspC domain-containing protein [Citricoccus]|uniref:PspC domain-containing protein n=1 Tax=Citricoccus TaxID=169133 RepID=UPI000255F36A|nr:PspC domain-containing protein [Citricoccus sp. CH26A]